MNALIKIGKDMVCFFCLLMDVTAGRAVNMPTTIFLYCRNAASDRNRGSHTHKAAAHDMMVTVWLRFLLLTYFSLCTLHHHDHPPPAHRYNQVIITAQSGSGE